MATETLNSSADTYITDASPTTNYGTASIGGARYGWFWSAVIRYKTLLNFDLSAIPADTALSPVLRVYCSGVSYTAGLTPVVKIHGLQVAFVETEATWTIRSTGNNWTTAGAGSSASDYYATEYGTLDLTTVSDGSWVEIPLTSTLTKADLTNGLLLLIDESTVPSPGYGGDEAWFNAYYREYSSGTYAPQLRLTYSSGGVPVASLNTVAAVTAVSSSAKQFSVTFSDDTAVDYSSIATGNCTITGPHGYSDSATLVSVDVESDGTPRVATYSTPAPTGGWSWLTNGTYTIAMVATQVCDTSSNYVAAGTLGTFSCNIAGAPTVRYYAYHTPTGEPFDGDAANHTISIVYGNTSESPWSDAREVDAAGKPGLYEVDLTTAQGAEAMLSLYGTTTTSNVRIQPVLNVPGPNYVPEADVVKWDGDATLVDKVAREFNANATGAVFIDGTHAASTTAFWTTLPLRADGYGNMVLRFDDGDMAGLWCDISIGVTDGSYTKITLATALNTAPANGVLVTAGGNKE